MRSSYEEGVQAGETPAAIAKDTSTATLGKRYEVLWILLHVDFLHVSFIAVMCKFELSLHFSSWGGHQLKLQSQVNVNGLSPVLVI